MEGAWFVRGRLYKLSGLPNYPGAELTDPYCTGFDTLHVASFVAMGLV